MNPALWMTQAQKLRERRQPFALVTVLKAIAPTSARPGDKAVVTADGQIHGWIGGGCAQPAVVKSVRRALREGRPQHIRITPQAEGTVHELSDILEFGMACPSGGTLELFVDPVLPPTPLMVVGDSPVAQSLLDLAPRVGFDVTLLAFGAKAEDYPELSVVMARGERELVQAQWGQGGLVVVATQGRLDLQGLEAALAAQPDHCWFVASHRKAQVLKAQLIQSGHDAAAVNAIVAPAGHAIGAKTAQEIALSVLAAVIAAHRGAPTLVSADTALQEA